MHDLLVVLAFLVMMAGPAIVASLPKTDSDDDA
jgi:hypothetical protein